MEDARGFRESNEPQSPPCLAPDRAEPPTGRMESAHMREFSPSPSMPHAQRVCEKVHADARHVTDLECARNNRVDARHSPRPMEAAYRVGSYPVISFRRLLSRPATIRRSMGMVPALCPVFPSLLFRPDCLPIQYQKDIRYYTLQLVRSEKRKIIL